LSRGIQKHVFELRISNTFTVSKASLPNDGIKCVQDLYKGLLMKNHILIAHLQGVVSYSGRLF